MNNVELFETICKCEYCGKAAAKPFCFPMHDQEVMLISAVPSLQAMYKPLPTIRFFRHICLALFGDKYLREKTQAEKYLREFCEGNIYWTHYRKCYQPGLQDFSSLADVCAKRFLSTEIRSLRPKIIVVLGNEIHDKVKAVAGDYKAEWLLKPFPTFENIADFEDLRYKLSESNRYVKKCAFAYSDGADRYSDQSAMDVGHATHLLFEREAFEQMLSKKELDISSNIDEVWYRNLIVPNMRRCAQLVQTYSYIENQIKVLLSDYFVSTGNYSILRSMRSPQEKASLEAVLKVIQEKWLTALTDFVRYRNDTLTGMGDSLKARMLTLKEYRNAIVHNGGMMIDRETRDESKSGLDGIYSFAGTVFISLKGEETLSKLVNDATDFLCEIQ